MKSAQQRFWPDAQPLVERLGSEFFRRLPQTAGVYLMQDAKESVLYIGKARNLRHRLCSYRVANPERMARRTLRLLNLVQGITWEECADETAALDRESELLLEIKPRFNRAGVWRGARRYVAWRSQATGLELAVLDSATAGWNLAGSFGAQAIHLHRALVRLMWCRLNPASGLRGMPAGWFYGAHGTTVMIPHGEEESIIETVEWLTVLAKGQHDGFTEWLGPVTIPFEQPMRDEDMELLVKHFVGRSVSACQ